MDYDGDMMVYFSNGCKAPFWRDRTSFKDKDGSFFTLSEAYQGEENYSTLLDEGRAVINWENVSFVKGIDKREQLDGE